MYEMFGLIWFCIIGVFLIKFAISKIIKRNADLLSEEYIYFSSSSFKKLFYKVPKYIKLSGTSSVLGQAYNQLTYILYVYGVVHILLLILIGCDVLSF